MVTHCTSNSLTIRRIAELCKDLPDDDLEYLIKLIETLKEGRNENTNF